jgi:hypothetical protein
MRAQLVRQRAPMTGKSRVIQATPRAAIDSSTMMMPSAAMSAILKVPMKLVPPTISAIGRAINEKLIIAPPTATASTSAEMKNCTSDEDDRTEIECSVPATISRYSLKWRSIERERSSRLSMLFPTRSSVCWMRRHCGIMRCSSSWRFALESRYSFSAAVCALTSDLWMSLSSGPTESSWRSSFATTSTA